MVKRFQHSEAYPILFPMELKYVYKETSKLLTNITNSENFIQLNQQNCGPSMFRS